MSEQETVKLTPSDIDLIAERVLHFFVRKGKIDVKAIELVLNDACNLNCTYCFEKEKTSRRWMGFDLGRVSIDYLFKKRSGNKKTLHFFGGEPFLSWGVMRDLIDYARSKEANPQLLGMSITTNATLIPKEAPSVLRNADVGVLVSVDPGKNAHNLHRIFKNGSPSFDIVWNNLNRLIDEDVYTSVRISLQPQYINDLVEFVKSCITQQVREIIIGAVLPAPWSAGDISAFCEVVRTLSSIEKDLRRTGSLTHIVLFDHNTPIKSCPAGKSLFAVSPEGRVFGCSRLLVANSGKGVALLGDIKSFVPDPISQRDISIGTRLSGCAAINYDENGNVLVPSQTHCHLEDALHAVIAECTGVDFHAGSELK